MVCEQLQPCIFLIPMMTLCQHKARDCYEPSRRTDMKQSLRRHTRQSVQNILKGLPNTYSAPVLVKALYNVSNNNTKVDWDIPILAMSVAICESHW
jgi:hypothetical protein